MNRIDRYLFWQCGLSSLIALAVMTFLILFPQVLNLVDLWVNKGTEVGVLGWLILLIIPQFLAGALPMALLTGILFALGRLAQDSELVILKASGLSLYRILLPMAVLTLFFTLLAMLLNLVWVPQSYHLFSNLKSDLNATARLIIRPQTFKHLEPGLTLFAREHRQGGRLFSGIVLYDRRHPEKPMTLTARSGQVLLREGGGVSLLLRQGSQFQTGTQGEYQQLGFAMYHIDLGPLLMRMIPPSEKKIKGAGLTELEWIMASGPRAYEARLEWHRRWAISAATLILGLLAVPMGFQKPLRSGGSYGFVVAVVALLANFLFLTLGETLVQQRILDPVAGMWIPNLLMAGLTLYVLVQTNRGKTFRTLTQPWGGVSPLRQRWMRWLFMRGQG